MAFDIQGARAAGYSDDEIADHLATLNGIDVATARKSGWDTPSLMAELSSEWAQKSLPAGVKDSGLGGGRGTVSPPMDGAPRETVRQQPAGGLAAAQIGGRRGTMRTGAAPYVAPDPLITDDPLSNPAPVEMRQPLIEQRGAPVRPEVAEAARAQLAAMPRDQRLAQGQRTDIPAWMRSTVQAANRDISAGDALNPALGVQGRSLEARTARALTQGADMPTARAAALGSALADRPLNLPGARSLTADEMAIADARKQGEAAAGDNPIRAGLYSAGQGVQQAGSGVAAMVLQAFGDDKGAKEFEQAGKVAKARADGAAELQQMRRRAAEIGLIPQGLTDAMGADGAAVLGAANSFGQMLPAMAAGFGTTLVTKNPAAGLDVATSIMGTQVAGQEYIAGREKGLNPGHAALRAATMGATEILFERFGLTPKIIGAFRTASGDVPTAELPQKAVAFLQALSRRGVATMAKEVASEEVTTVTQYLVDGSPLGLNQPISVGELLGQMRDTAVQTMMLTGMMMAPGAVMNAGRQGDALRAPQPIPQQPQGAAPQPIIPPQQPAQPQPGQPQAAQAVDNIVGTLRQAGALPQDAIPAADLVDGQDFTGLDTPAPAAQAAPASQVAQEAIPVGDATEVIPTGDATEVDPIPVGQATEMLPTADATELDPIPVGDATEIAPEVIQADDIMAADGEPFTSRTSAAAKAYSAGGGEVVRIPNHFGSGKPGFVVRPIVEARPAGTRGTDARDLPAQQLATAAPVAQPQPLPGGADEVAASESNDRPMAAGQPVATEQPQRKTKVYKNRGVADAARKASGNTVKVQKVKGGYILRPKTDAEIEAEAKNAKRLTARKTIDVQRDPLLVAIAKNGGLAPTEKADTIGEGNKLTRGGHVFSATGLPIDTMAEYLAEDGYIPPQEMERDGGTTWLRDAIKAEHMGTREHFSQRGEGWLEDRMAEMERQAQMDAEGDPFGPLADLTTEDLESSGYTQASPEVQELTEQLMADAEAAGIDTEAIRERVAMQNDGATADEYEAALQAAVRQALGQDRRGAEAGDARAEGAGDQDRGQADGGQEQGAGQGLTLEAQTAEDLRAKADAANAAQPIDTTAEGVETAPAAAQTEQPAPRSASADAQAAQDQPQDQPGTTGVGAGASRPVPAAQQQDRRRAAAEAVRQAKVLKTNANSAMVWQIIGPDGEAMDGPPGVYPGREGPLAGSLTMGQRGWKTKREADAALAALKARADEILGAPQQQAPAEAVATPQPEPAALENFGEQLPPARRNMAAKLSEDLSDGDIAGKPLSEIWPQSENDAIEDTYAAAVAHAARAEIPAKPRVAYKLKSWVQKVQMLRSLAGKIVGGTVTRERFERDIVPDGARFTSLRDWYAKVLLLEQVLRDQWKRIGEVMERPDAYTYVDGKEVPAPMVRVEVDGKTHWLRGDFGVEGKAKGTLAGNRASIMALLGTDAPQQRLKFEIRRSTRTGAVFINKEGDPQRRKLMEFADVAEARKAMAEKYDALVAAWEAVKARDNITERDLRSAENRPRVGRDHRQGRDATPQEFQDTFGFRGGEFGKWVQQGKGDKERQAILNDAFDALMDLSDLLGIPPRAISLNGTLGIAFGSRGSGSASAHFEPSNLVINLTKTRGAGALGHEWFHALDNYFSRMRRGGKEAPFSGNQRDYRDENYITHRPEPLMIHKTQRSTPITRGRLEGLHAANPKSGYYNPENWQPDPKHLLGVRPEVEERFAALVSALDKSPMSERARTLDGIKESGDGYWSRTLERAARAFENYLQGKMQDQGYHNDFLAIVVAAEDTGRNPDRYPYLLPDEQKPIREAFDALFATIQTRADQETGNVAMFSRATGAGLPIADAQESVAAIREGMPSAPPIDVHATLADAPAELQAIIRQAGAANDVEGVYWQGRIHVFPQHIASRERLEFVVGHHEVRHHGLAALLGDERVPLMRRLYATNKAVREGADAYLKANPFADRATAVEEALADMPVDRMQSLRGWQRIVAAIRDGLRRFANAIRAKLPGLAAAIEPAEWTDADITALVRRAEDVSRAPVQQVTPDMQAAPMFSRSVQRDDAAGEAPASGGTDSTMRSGWIDRIGRVQSAPGQALYDLIGRAASPLLLKAGLKSASPELRRMLRAMRLDVQKAQDVAVAVAREGTKLSDAERAMVSDIVEKEVAAGTIPPEHAVRLAEAMSAAMTRQSGELVSLGMLSDSAAQRWDGKYLPRYYESKLRPKVADAWADALMRITRRASPLKGIRGKHLKGRSLFETIPAGSLQDYLDLGWEVRDDGYKPGQSAEVQVWRDFTREERDNMGEIRDAVFRFVMGYMQTQRDIALGRMFQTLAQDERHSSRLPRDGWVKVPETVVEGTGVRRYGMLSGRYVPQEVLSHLSQIEETDSAAWQLYRRALGIWKMGKTVLNPVAHANNIISNLTMAHFGGVSYHRADKYVGAIRDIASRGPLFQEARENGLVLSTMSAAEMMNIMPDELQELAAKAESKTERGAKLVFDLMTWFLRKPMGKAYEAEDLFFRFLLYREARGGGMEPQDAVDYAQRYIFTYDDLPKGARMIRDFALPFFAYTYKAIPALLHTATVYPHRFVAPAGVLWAANAIGYAIAAGDDDDDWWETVQKYINDPEFRKKAQEKEKLEREFLPPWQKGSSALLTPKAIRLGMDELTNLPLFLDASRMIPGGDLFDVSPNAGGLPLPQPLTPSHPLLTVVTGMLGNRDLFTGKDLVDKNDDAGEAAAKRSDWLWKQASPAITINNYHWERLMQAAAHANGGPIEWVPDVVGGEATGVGRDGLPVQPKYAAAQTFGIKVRPFDQKRSQDIEAGKKAQLIRGIEAEMRQLERLGTLGALSPQSVFDKKSKLMDKRDKIRAGEPEEATQ